MADDQKNVSPSTLELSAVVKGMPKAAEGVKQVKDLIEGLASFSGAAEGGGTKKLNAAKLALEALAYFGDATLKGKRETVAFDNARLVSGNPAGFTNDQLREISLQIKGQDGTLAQASKVTAALVATGKVQRNAIVDVGTATAELNRLQGVPIEESVAKFVELRKEPTKKSIEYNRSGSRRYVTGEMLQKISGLEAKGDLEAAGSLAQKAFALDQTRLVRQQDRGRIFPDRAVSFVENAVTRLDDSVRSLGRDQTLQQKIDWADELYERQRKQEASRGNKSSSGPFTSGPRVSLEERDQERKALRELQREDRRAVDIQADNAARDAASFDAAAEAWEGADGAKKAEESIARAAGSVVAKRSTARGLARSATPIAAGIQRAEGDGLRPCIEVVCGCKAGATDQAKQGAQKAATSETAERASIDPEQARHAALVESMRKATSGVLDQTTALDAQNTAHGKTKSALKELNIAQLERQYQDLDNTEQVIPGYLEALGARIEAEKELLKVTRNSEGIEAANKEKTKRDAKATKMSDDIGGAFREGFTGFLQGDDKAFDKMGESLKKKIVSSIADALYDTSLKPAVEAFSGWFSGLFKGGSSGGGASAGGSSGDNWLGSLVNGVMKFFVTSANGNVFSSPGLHAYANSVVGKPTFFPFANGIGLMGEAGPEAIMPLRRGSDGRLGVSAQGSGSGGALHYAPSTVFHIDSRSDRGAVMADLDRALQANNQGQMEQLKRMRVVPQ